MKSADEMGWQGDWRRSREGAWIEISTVQMATRRKACRSREGAWIEIKYAGDVYPYDRVAPARERGLKCYVLGLGNTNGAVAPARERGLK